MKNNIKYSAVAPVNDPNRRRWRVTLHNGHATTINLENKLEAKEAKSQASQILGVPAGKIKEIVLA